MELRKGQRTLIVGKKNHKMQGWGSVASHVCQYVLHVSDVLHLGQDHKPRTKELKNTWVTVRKKDNYERSGELWNKESIGENGEL